MDESTLTMLDAIAKGVAREDSLRACSNLTAHVVSMCILARTALAEAGFSDDFIEQFCHGVFERVWPSPETAMQVLALQHGFGPDED